MLLKKMFSAICISFTLIAPLAAQSELITNGSFSNGATYWNLGQYGGSSQGYVTGGEYRISVSRTGTEHWHVQFTQNNLTLEQGKTYIFSFDARKGTANSGTQRMQVNVGQAYSPWTSYFGQQNMMVTLSTTTTHYNYTIVMEEPTDNNARVEFNCGLSTGSFYIDNVSVQEAVATDPLLSATPLSIDFGTIAIGGSTTEDITLINTGGSATTISAIQSSSGDFTFALTTPVDVVAGGSMSLPVTFSPTTTGTRSGTITFYSNAVDNPQITVALSGEAINPGIVLSTSSLSFSSGPDIPVYQTFTIANTGTAPITWSIATNDPWITSITPSAGTISASSDISCSVTAAGSVTGTFSGALSLMHSASNEPSPIIITADLSITEGYQPTSPYILYPETNIEFIRDIAAFRMHQRDNTNGGFYTHIDRQGNPTGENIKALCGQSRIAYTFVRAFMVTGDEQYLEYAHYALKFLYDHGWNNGWYFVTQLDGDYMSHWGHNDWWSFQQHYALVGISAMVEATGGTVNWGDGSQSDHTWLMRGVNSNYTKLWDAGSATKGYYDHSNTEWTNKWGKGFTPTVDGVTTHALLMSMMYDSTNHDQRLVELADNIVDHMVGSMPVSSAGFPEVYNADWNIDYGSTNMDIGHGYKTAWVLQRAYLMHPDHPEYLAGAQALMQDLWDNGAYDEVYGGPYSNLNWQTGAITNTNKDFWMVEQGLTSGLISYYTASTQEQRDMYLTVADGSINFFMNHQMDPVYGEAYDKVSRDGTSIVNNGKGGLFTAGYHSSELGYYAYLYSSLYYHKSPVELYYYYPEADEERTFKLTPVPIEEELLKITAVTLDGSPYTDFDPDARTIHLAAGEGGKLKVTFGFTPSVTYTVTATAGNNGTISPSGAVTVSEGGSQSFMISADEGFSISDVTVDGTSQGAVGTYTFTNITSDHTIHATFTALPTYTIQANAGVGGSITPDGTITVYGNGSQTFTISPAAGYRIEDVLIDGVSGGAISSYTFSSVNANHTIAAEFETVPTWTISASASTGGAISPSGTVTVTEGTSQTFTFNAETGYTLTGLTVDGSSVTPASEYTFSSVTEDHTINAEFTLSTYTISASAGAGGSISPSGQVTLTHGSSRTFTITPENGYEIAGVSIDGSSVGAVNTYTFSSISASHTINATFSMIDPLVYQVNCGSGNAAIPFSGDQFGSGGTLRSVSNAIDRSDVTDPAPQAVYQSERYGNSSYTFPSLTPAAPYLVRLHFAELYWTSTNKRLFDVGINGITVLSDYDIYAETGSRYKAVIHEFITSATASGEIAINFNTITDNATIEGIEIIETVPDNPPSIVTPAAANPDVVSGLTTTLSVLGDDDNGEGALTYIWSVSSGSPAQATFSDNGTNTSKSAVATFSQAGNYELTATVSDQRGNTATSSVNVTVEQTLTSIEITPRDISLATSAIQQFSATALDQFGTPLSVQPSFTWSLNGDGTIDQSGLYTAPTAAGGPYEITVQSGTFSAITHVTVTDLPQIIYQVNCGSTNTVYPFSGDQYGSGGTLRSVSNWIDLSGVTDPAPQDVYRSERYGNSSYTFPGLIPGSMYTIRLHFAELYWTSTGKRSFNVTVNGTTVLSNYDIYAETGARYKAVVHEYTATVDGSGEIDLNFITNTDNATIEAIEIIR